MPQISGIFRVSQIYDLRFSKKDKSYIEFSVASIDSYKGSKYLTPKSEEYNFECVAYDALAKDIFDIINEKDYLHISGKLSFNRTSKRIIEVTTFEKIIDDDPKENDDENYKDDDFNDDIKF